MRWLIVDGYNIIGAWPDLAAVREDSLDEARLLLIGLLKEYAATSAMQVKLVFDGYRVSGSRGSVEKSEGIEVIYTAEGITADMAIERLVTKVPRFDQCYVASSDRLVQETILTQGALRISAQELRRMIAIDKTETRRRMQSLPAPSTLDARLDPGVREKLSALVFLPDNEKN